jgi:hypothetical protein
MLTDKISIGTKFGTEKFAVEVSVKIAESMGDMLGIAAGPRKQVNMTEGERKLAEEFVVAMFNRGWRIWAQERSGARDFVASATVAERKDVASLTAKVQKIVNDADPLAPAKRVGRPAKPAEVNMTDEVAKAMKKGDTKALAELLAAQGVKITFNTNA